MFKCSYIPVLILLFIYLTNIFEDAMGYDIYWNVPTFMCHKYGLNFTSVSKIFGIIQNENDDFYGREIAILYHPGYLPAWIRVDKVPTIEINGRVPQCGDLQYHLDQLKIDVDKQISPDLQGIGIIDYERWRPIFIQNWGHNSLEHYRTLSEKIEKDNFPILSMSQTTAVAEKAFEYAARNFFEESIKIIKQLRGNASWAMYDYPKCYNLSSKNWNNPQCSKEAKAGNDRMAWLFDHSDIVISSIYISKIYKWGGNITTFVSGRLNETHRIANKYNPPKKIYPYLRYRYKDYQDEFIKKEDYAAVFNELHVQNVDGLIIWGSSEDVNTEQNCLNLLQHLHEVMGPAILEFL